MKARFTVETENATIHVNSCPTSGLSMLVEADTRTVRVTFETPAEVDELIAALEKARGRE